jgi:pimeloyl-ACP methyl ester carboxylesterase
LFVSAFSCDRRSALLSRTHHAFQHRFARAVPVVTGVGAVRSALHVEGPYGNNPAAGRYAAVGSVKIYYEVYGSGPPVLLLHGNGGSISGRACQIEYLAPTHRLIAVDSRGHGKSDDGPGALTFEQQADDFIAVLDAEHIERADVLGHSDGGILALELGIRHPDRIGKIIASSPNLTPDAVNNFDSELKSLEQATQMVAAHDTTRDWVRRKRQLELDINEPHISFDAVHTIPSPVLLVGADGDVIPLEHLVQIFHALQHGQLFIRPGALHGNLDEVFNAVVARFLDQPFSRPMPPR